jgi:hypothetical protein
LLCFHYTFFEARLSLRLISIDIPSTKLSLDYFVLE